MTENEDDDESYPPWNFSWVVENELAAMAWPQTKGNLSYLFNEGIRHLVTLSPEKIPPIEEFPQLEWTQIPVEEFEAPSVKDIVKFIDVCQKCQLKNQPVGVHSRMGRDRTGVMAACYLVRFRGLDPENALIELKAKRPRSVEEPELETAVTEYYESIKQKES